MPINTTFGDETKNGAPRQKTAVAIDSGKGTYAIPKVIASGRGILAEQILKLAFEHDIKVRQDDDLVELLAVLDLDHHIPAEAVVAVAEILARVFQANADMVKGIMPEEPHQGEGS